LLVAVVLVGVSLWSALESDFVRSRVRDKLAQAVRAELGLDASLGGLQFRLPFRIAAYSIRLNHPRHGLLVSARELQVVPSFWGLLAGELKLKRLMIEGARVRLKVEDGRVLNLPNFRSRDRSKEEDDAPLDIPLDELVIHHAQVDVEAEGPRLKGSIGAVNVVARITDGARMTVQLSAGRGALEHDQGVERIDRLTLGGRYRPGRLEIDQLRFDSSVLRLGLARASFDLPATVGRYRTELSAELDLLRFQRLPLGLALPDMQGTIALKTTLEGHAAKLRATGTVHGERPVLAGFGFGYLDLRFEANEREIKLLAGSRGRVIEDGGLVLLEGKIGLSRELPLEVRADVKHLVFQKLMAQLGTTQDCVVDWILKGGFRLKGTANPVAITGPIWADHVSFRALTGAYHDPKSREIIGTAKGKVSGRVVIRPDALRFEGLHGRLPHSDVYTTVHIGFDDKLSVVAKSDNLDLRDATGLMGDPIAGRGSFTLDVGPTYDDCGLTGTLDMQDFAFWGDPIGHVKTSAVLEKDGTAVRFPELEVRKNDSHYFVDDLTLDFSEEFALTGKARFERLTLSDFYDTVQVGADPDFTTYQGALKGSATARYTIGFRDDGPDGTLVAEADMEVLDAHAYGLDFDGGRIDATFTWRDVQAGTRGARLDLRELRLTKGRGALWARGLMNYGATLRLTLLGEALRARDLDALRKSALPLEGELNLSGTLRGSLDLPELALDVELVGMQLGSRSLGDGHAKLHFTHRNDPWVQKALALDEATAARGEPCARARRALARASWPGDLRPDGAREPPQALLVCGPLLRDRLDVDLAIGLDPDVSLRGRASFSEVPTAWFAPEDAGKLAALDGRLSGSTTITGGNLTHPDSLVGAFELSRFALGGKQPWIRNDGPIEIALTGRGARVENARFVGEGTQIAFRGGASLADGLAANIAGTLDLRILSTFVPNIERSRGMLGVDVKLTGVFRDPAIFGRAEIRDASVLTSFYPLPIDGIAARLAFSEREILLEELSARFAGGQLGMHGAAALRGRSLERYELALDARDVSLEPMSGVELTLSGDTTLLGGAGMRLPKLAGTVHVQRARYTRPFSLGIAERLTGFSQAKRAERAAYDPAADRIALDLRVIDDAPLRINNNLLNAELTIEDSERPFRIVGTDQRLGLLGTLDVQRGSLRFRSSEFRVEDGTVDFIDEHRIHPRVDVRARTEFRRTADVSGSRWSIMLHASGDIDDLKLETSSEPALASEDIALLLTVGLTRAEAERLNSGSLTQGAALEALATVAGVDREVKRALPVIDDFAVTSAFSVRTNRTEPYVVVGKRLSDRVRATATTGLTTDSNFKTNLEWRLNDQTSVEAGYDNVQTTTASQFGNVGVDLRWRLEFD
jgi:translocation and assembly module TamB